MRAIIIDDDASSVNLLQKFCNKTPLIQEVRSYADPKLALSFLEKEPTDLLFMDIEMSVIPDLDILNQLSYTPYVIFTTSKSLYAFEAFEFEGVDYLKKPFNFLLFQKAINKLLVQSPINKPSLNQDRNIYIKEKGKFIRISLDDILYFENVRDYVCVKTDKNTFTIIKTLKEVERNLPSDTFLKVHRSYIINMNKVINIDNSTLVIKNKVIPISRVNRPVLMNKIRFI